MDASTTPASTAQADSGPAKNTAVAAEAAPAQDAGVVAVAAEAAPAGQMAAQGVAPAATEAPAADTAIARTVAGVPARPATKTTALTMQQSTHTAPPSAAGSVGGTLFALALVIGLIFGLAWLARRMPGLGGARGNSGLRVVRTLPLGTRERLVVVEVAGTQLLLGSGASGTRLLHTLETPLPADPPAQPVPFAQLLAQRLGKKPA